MLRFSIRLVTLLAIGLVQSSCGAPPDSMTLRAPSTSTALASPWSSALMGGALAPAQKRRNASDPTYVFVSDPSKGKVFKCKEPLCNSKGKVFTCKAPLCTSCITVGISSDVQTVTSTSLGSSDYLYIVLMNAAEIVVVKPTAYSCRVVRTLKDPHEYPIGVAVRPDGWAAVPSLCSAPKCGPGNIAFYAPKATSPSYYATGLLSRYYFGDFDLKGNFYNDGLNAKGEAVVGVVQAGSKTDKATGISGISSPGGIQIASDDTINVDDPVCQCIKIYKGSTHVGTVSLKGTTDPESFALDEKNHYLWVTDVAAGAIDQFRYPDGGSIVQSFTGFVEPVGVALTPPDNP